MKITMMKFALFTLAAVSIVSPTMGATLTHQYLFNGSLADQFAGPSLVSGGGTVGAGSYTFAAGQGLSLSNALTANDDYSILLDFSFTNVNGYRKIVDFKGLASDNGFYNLNSAENFYPVITGGSVFSANAPARVIITRNSANNVFQAYFNGTSQFFIR